MKNLNIILFASTFSCISTM